MKITTWNQDLYQKAISFAAHAHRNQFVPGKDYCYVVHLSNVAAEIGRAVCAGEIDDPDLAIQCALLHDVIEDTEMIADQVSAEFGNDVLAGVLALTKDKALPKAEKMADSLGRIKEQAQAIACVKLADRITNLQPPPAHWDAEKKRTYLAEAQLILNELGYASRLLSDRLGEKIKSYKSYL